jgi:TIR domain/Domain of unknown function (DUF5679)
MDYDDNNPEPIEAYCVHCRETVEMEDPVAVWTRRGMPATRGDCPICGGTVFRMGKSSAHDHQDMPESAPRVKLTRETVYIDFASADTEIAEQLAVELERVGVTCWLHESTPDNVNWASGVHPALNTCARMIYVLSAATLEDERVEAAWRYFREKNKPIVIALVGSAAPPDDLRRRPRFDFTDNYKTAFRQLLQTLNDGR